MVEEWPERVPVEREVTSVPDWPHDFGVEEALGRCLREMVPQVPCGTNPRADLTFEVSRETYHYVIRLSSLPKEVRTKIGGDLHKVYQAYRAAFNDAHTGPRYMKDDFNGIGEGAYQLWIRSWVAIHHLLGSGGVWGATTFRLKKGVPRGD